MLTDSRIFSLRQPHALAARLERAKAVFGHSERSTGEVARRLFEQRLDQQAQQEAQQQARQTLRDLLGRHRSAPRLDTGGGRRPAPAHAGDGICGVSTARGARARRAP
jgi:hypothetical protein